MKKNNKKTVWDFLHSINISKENIMITEEDIKLYVPFIVNRSLSYFQDTILICNEMNISPHLPKKAQYLFLLNMIRKKRRFSKWYKPTEDEKITIIKEYYGYSTARALEVADLLTQKDISKMKQLMD